MVGGCGCAKTRSGASTNATGPFFQYGVVVTDLRLKPRLFTTPGIVFEHLKASCGFAAAEGRIYVDGGVMNPLPLWAATEMGATDILAINVLPQLPGSLLRACIWFLPRLGPGISTAGLGREGHDPRTGSPAGPYAACRLLQRSQRPKVAGARTGRMPGADRPAYRLGCVQNHLRAAEQCQRLAGLLALHRRIPNLRRSPSMRTDGFA